MGNRSYRYFVTRDLETGHDVEALIKLHVGDLDKTICVAAPWVNTILVCFVRKLKTEIAAKVFSKALTRHV